MNILSPLSKKKNNEKLNTESKMVGLFIHCVCVYVFERERERESERESEREREDAYL